MIPLFITPTNCALEEERVGKSFHFTLCSDLLFSFYFVFRSSSQKYLLKVRGCNIFPCQHISRFTCLFALPTDFHLCLVGKCPAQPCHRPITNPYPHLPHWLVFCGAVKSGESSKKLDWPPADLLLAKSTIRTGLQACKMRY